MNVALMLRGRVPLRLGELARASNLPRQIVASVLLTLERRSIAKRTRVGDHDVFAPDVSSPYYPSAYLTALVHLPVPAALGDQRAMAAVREAVSRVGQRLERRMDAFLLSPEELEAGRRSGDAHVRAALAGVRLFGEV